MDRPALRTLVDKKDLVGAEIGVAQGKNALDILGKLDIKKLYLIDPYMTFRNTPKHKQVRVTTGTIVGKRQAIEKLAPYKDRIEYIYDISASAVSRIENEELDFVYIDGNHWYQNVIEDVTLYYPKVKIGGLVSGHDYDVADVKRAVDEVLFGVEIGRKKNGQTDWWVIKGEGR